MIGRPQNTQSKEGKEEEPATKKRKRGKYKSEEAEVQRDREERPCKRSSRRRDPETSSRW